MPASRLIPVDKIHVVTYRLLRPDSDCEFHCRGALVPRVRPRRRGGVSRGDSLQARAHVSYDPRLLHPIVRPVRDGSGSGGDVFQSGDMAWHGAWRAGRDRVYDHAFELFRDLSPLPEKPSVADVCGVDARGVHHHRARNRASQSRSAWGDGRFTWSFSAHRTGRLFRLDVRFCHETSYAQTCLFVYELHPWRLVTWEECVKK